MSMLSFLKKATIEEAKATASKSGGPRKQWQPNPSIVAVRVHKDGSVFPSKAAIEKFDLEYKNGIVTVENIAAKAAVLNEDQTVKVPAKEAYTKNVYSFTGGQGNGLDVISSKSWGQFKSDVEGAMLFVAVTPKDQPKVDLFGTVNYDGKGKPKVSVEEQGAATYGKTVLIPMLEEIYGVVFQQDADEETKTPEIKGVDYVDMVIFESYGTGLDAINITETYSKNIILVPKRIARGVDKGKDDYERRENVKVYGFAPYYIVFGEGEQEKEVANGPGLTIPADELVNANGAAALS